MATANLSSRNTVYTTNDSVVIVKYIEGILGGRALDVEGFPDRELSIISGTYHHQRDRIWRV